MKRKQGKQTFFAAAVILIGFAAVFLLSQFLQQNAAPLPEGIEDEDLAFQGSKIKGFTLGFDGLIADWYWMKSLQYIGDKIIGSEEPLDINDLKSLNPRLLYPYLDNATDLDPRFIEAYSYGANVLPAIERSQAIKIVEKGIANNPDQWRLYHYLGYIYWRIGYFEKASEIYDQGTKIKDAPDWMRLMSAKIKSEGGSRETAREIYRQMFEQSTDDQSRESANIRLMQLDSLDERDGIRAALKKFKEKNNRCATGWREVLPFLQAIKLPADKSYRLDASNNPVDPSDAPYILNQQRCDVELDEQKTKIPLL